MSIWLYESVFHFLIQIFWHSLLQGLNRDKTKYSNRWLSLNKSLEYQQQSNYAVKPEKRKWNPDQKKEEERLYLLMRTETSDELDWNTNEASRFDEYIKGIKEVWTLPIREGERSLSVFLFEMRKVKLRVEARHPKRLIADL